MGVHVEAMCKYGTLGASSTSCGPLYPARHC